MPERTKLIDSLLDRTRRILAGGTSALLAHALAEGGLVASVVMATRNKASYLEYTLLTLERQTLSGKFWEVVIVDDASEDETPEVLTKYEKRGRLNMVRLRCVVSRGRSGARNEALAEAHGRIVVFLDDDRLVEPDFLIQHLRNHVAGPAVVLGESCQNIYTHAVSGFDPDRLRGMSSLRGARAASSHDRFPDRILWPDEVCSFWRYSSLITSSDDRAGEAFRFFRDQPADHPIPWVHFITANASVPHDQLVAVGGFDEGFRGWGLEDTDLALRLHAHGLPFRYEPRARVTHQHHPREANEEKFHSRNFRYFFAKHQALHPGEIEPLLRGASVADRFNSWQAPNQEVIPAPCSRFSERGMFVLWCVNARDPEAIRRSAPLIRELHRSRSGDQVHLVCSGASAAALQKHESSRFGTVIGCSCAADMGEWKQLIIDSHPDLIVSAGEPLALAAARAADLPTVYLAGDPSDGANDYEDCRNGEAKIALLQQATRILLAQPRGFSETPEPLRNRVYSCGPWLDDVVARPEEDWRSLLNARSRPLVVVVGNSGSHEELALFDLVGRASMQMTFPVRFIAIGGPLASKLRVQGTLPQDVLLVEAVPVAADLFRQADLILTCGAQSLLWEQVVTGTPTIVIPVKGGGSTGVSSRMAELGLCLCLSSSVTSDELRSAITQVLRTPLGTRLRSSAGRIDVAAMRREAIQHLVEAAEAKD